MLIPPLSERLELNFEVPLPLPPLSRSRGRYAPPPPLPHTNTHYAVNGPVEREMRLAHSGATTESVTHRRRYLPGRPRPGPALLRALRTQSDVLI